MDEILVNTNTLGDQHQPGVAGLSGTQFIVVWADQQTNNIKAQLLGVDGQRHGGDVEVVVNFPQQPGTKRQLPTVIETGQGFAVAWIEQLPGGQPQVQLRVFNLDTMSGPESQVSTAEVEPLIRPTMARLNDGGFVLLWADKRQDQRIRAQRFEVDGTKRGTEFRANTVAGLHRHPIAAGLTNGNLVIGWRARLPGPLLVHLQMFGATGPLGTEQTTTLDVTDIAMAPLDTGLFVIAHVRSALDGETGFDTTIAQLSVFDQAGVLSNTFPATSPQRIQSAWPTLAPLPGGRFLLAWTEVNVDNVATGTNVAARIFSSQGPLGKALQVNTLRGGQRFSLSAATTSGPAGDTAYFAWADDSKAGPDTSGRAVEGRALPIPAGGFQ
jgi:hypothetical protein